MKTCTNLLTFLAALFVSGYSISQTVSFTSSGGLYSSEKWISITTSAGATGTVVWAQGNGTQGNASGLLTNESIDLSGYSGQTLFLNAFDKYDDTWDGTVYVLRAADGVAIINNFGLS